MAIDIDPDWIRDRVRDMCKSFGGQAAFAREIGVSRSHINGILSGRKEPYGSVLAHFGLERVTVIRKRRIGGRADG